jgi:hypothetical protein
MERKDPNEITTHPTLESLFPINPALLEKIQQDMRDGTYDLSQPIILATWQGQTEPVCIDGHTRRQAAINAGIEEVPVWIHEFNTEEEAIEKAIKLQSNRRNLSDADLLQCIERLYERRPRGGDRRSDVAKSMPQGCGNENGRSAAAKHTADLLNISPRRVEQALTIINQGSPEVKESVQKGKLSINSAYGKTQERRRSSKPDADSKSAEEPSEQPLNVVPQIEEPKPPQNCFPESWGRSVHVFLPDWQYLALIRMDGFVETHVKKAVGFYLESLGIREEPEDDDDEDYFAPEDYEQD